MASTDWYHRTTAGLPRIEPLTGLRWFAALAVFLSHFSPGGTTPAIVQNFCKSGYMGVTVFFVLSGFILTVTYERSLSSPTAARIGNYAVARFARVYPLYLLVLLWVLTQPDAAVPSGWWTHVIAVQTWSPQLSLAYALNGPGWSIGVEFFLYACFPFLIVALRRPLSSVRGSTWVAIVAVAVIAGVLVWMYVSGGVDLPWDDPASAHRWIYRTPLTRLGDFALGMGIAGLFLSLRPHHEGARWAVWASCAALVFIVGAMCIPALLYTPISFDLLYAVPAALLILGLALAPQSGLARPLGAVPVVALGEASYAFYLIHVPVGLALGADALSSGATIARLILFAISLLLLIALSWGLHVIVERPSRIGIRRLVHFTAR